MFNRKMALWGIIVLGVICTAALFCIYIHLSGQPETINVSITPNVDTPAESADKPLTPHIQINTPPQSVKSVNLKPTPAAEQNSPALPAEPNREQIEKVVMDKIKHAFAGGNRTKARKDRTKLFAVLHDKTGSINKRCNAAFILAKEANEANFHQFMDIFYDAQAPAELKAAILEGIGHSDISAKIEMIQDGLKDSDEEVVCGAIRGLQGFSDDYAVNILAEFVNSNETSAKIKSEAISSLGGIKNPASTKILTDAYYSFLDAGNNNFSTEIITATGQKDFGQTEAFFTDVLKNSGKDASSRLAVAEALENSDDQAASSILVPLLNDPDSQVRATAAWSLATASETGDISAELLDAVKRETDSQAKKRLYQALGNQENINTAEVIPSITTETDVSTKITGYNLVATKLYEKDRQVQDWFVANALPELKDTALNAETLNTKLNAVIAIKNAGLEQTEQVLLEIAETSKDQRVVQATGLK